MKGISMKESLLEEVKAERDRQDGKWGGADFDAAHNTPDYWHNLIADYNGWQRRMGLMGSRDKQRRRLIQLSAIALAAVEQIDAGL
jgi:hypothetical protein